MGAGRPKGTAKLDDPDRRKRLISAIKVGATYELACGYAGIHYDTFHEYRKHNPDFVEELKEAEGAAAVTWLTRIELAAQGGQWQAAAWKLERRYPHEFGKTVQEQQHTGKDGGPIQFRGINVPLPPRDDDDAGGSEPELDPDDRTP